MVEECWSDGMSTTDKIIIAILAACCVAILALMPRPAPCEAAEFGPDVPQHVKDQCRNNRK